MRPFAFTAEGLQVDHDVRQDVDIAASTILIATFALVFVLHALARASAKPSEAEVFSRLDREAPLPVVGKAPMVAIYAAVVPFAQMLGRWGVRANTVTLSSIVFAACASVAFASGHFGVGAVAATLASLADVVDGFVARATKSADVGGQVLDTIVDRYVDALFIGGIAVFVRREPWFLVLALSALVGSAMVSYASAVVRELGVVERNPPMRRVERSIWIIASTVLVPFVAIAAPDASVWITLSPVAVALTVLAFVGNFSVFRRLDRAVRAWAETSRDAREPAPSSAGYRRP